MTRAHRCTRPSAAFLVLAAASVAAGQVGQAPVVPAELPPVSTFGESATIAPEPAASFLQDPLDVLWLLADRRDLEPVPAASIVPQEPIDNLPFVIGINQKISEALTIENSGTWSVEPDGSWVWRLIVRQPDAVAIRLHMADCNLPEDAEFIVGDPGGFAANRLTPINVGPDGSLWTPAIPGDTMYIELHCSQHPESVPFRMVEAAHIWDDSFSADPYGPRGFSGCAANACHIDVACQTTNTNARNSVGRMVFSNGASQALCTGTLITDFDPSNQIPYFLTANHCISTQAAASSLTVTWFYQSASCGGSIPNPANLPSTTGATLLANNPSNSSLGGTDLCFLQLSSLAGGVGLAGFTTASPNSTDTLTGIHHPAGCRKRFSTNVNSAAPLQCDGLASTHFLLLDRVLGMTQGGSSGSALFNPSWQVVGQLFGLCAADGSCGSTSVTVVYGRLGVAYPEIEPFLGSRYGTWGRPNTSQIAPDGTPARPYTVLTQQLAQTPSGGRAWLYPSSSPTPVLINQSVTIRSFGGVATIGR